MQLGLIYTFGSSRAGHAGAAAGAAAAGFKAGRVSTAGGSSAGSQGGIDDGDEEERASMLTGGGVSVSGGSGGHARGASADRVMVSSPTPATGAMGAAVDIESVGSAARAPLREVSLVSDARPDAPGLTARVVAGGSGGAGGYADRDKQR